MITGYKLNRVLGTLVCFTALAGCASVSHPPATTTTTETPTTSAQAVSWKDRQAKLTSIQSFRVDGKIAVRTPRDSGSATVNWVQRHSSYSIALMGPLGSNGLKLQGQPGNVTLQTSDGKTYSANSAEQLLKERWGFHLPVSNMHYWIRGLPVPGMAANTRFDSDGRLSQLVQQGWNIQYLSYTKMGNVDLPEKMSITSPSLTVKIVIYQWNIG